MAHFLSTVAHTLLIALALVMAGMLAVDFWPDQAYAAITYSPTTTAKFCNGLPADFPSTIAFDDPDLVGNPACTDPSPIATGAAYPLTASFSLPGGHSDSGSPLFTSFSPDTFVAPDAGGTGIADGTKVGGVVMMSTLGLASFACTSTLTTEFTLYESTTTLGSVSPLPEGAANRNRPLVTDYEEGTANGIINTADDSYVDGYAVIDGKLDINYDGVTNASDDGTLRGLTVTDGIVAVADGTIGDGPGGAVTDITYKSGMVDGTGNSMANADSPFVSNNVSFYPTWFDPDLDYPGGPNGPLLPVVPRARYSGMTRVPAVTGDWRIMSLFVFDPGALAPFSADADNRPHPFGRFSRAPGDSLVSFAITDDPTAVKIIPNPITDTCSPLQVDTMLLGTVPGGATRSKTPPTNGTRIIGQWSFSQRNADTDSLENPLDTCPFTANTDDGHRIPPDDHDGRDHDGDGINDACDAGVGFPSGGSCSSTDVDCDGFGNGQDNCPQTPNAGALQKDGELLQTYLTAAPDGGPRGDSIGDACEGVISTGCSLGGAPNTNTIDDDGDGVVNDGCPGGPAAAGPGGPGCAAPCPESDTKGDNPSGLGSATVANGDFIENYNFVPKCIGPGPDSDLDHYCFAQDPDDSVATGGAVKGFGLNHGPDTEGNSSTILSVKYAGNKADHYGADDENYMGTDVYEACPADATPNNEAVDAWPPDFNDDRKVDATDMALLTAQLGAVTTAARARFDLVPNKMIDGADQAAVTAATGSLSCTDDDNDGFSNADETTIGTLPLVPCGTNAWPPDFDDNHTVDISDVLALKPVFGSSVPPASPRFDISPGGGIDISDVLALKPFFGASC